jgi:hypothetical protein
MDSTRRRRGSGGWVHGLFVVFVMVGLWVGTEDPDPPAAPEPVTSSCHGVPYTEAERGSAQTLVDAGWHATGTRLYPPHCR